MLVGWSGTGGGVLELFGPRVTGKAVGPQFDGRNAPVWPLECRQLMSRKSCHILTESKSKRNIPKGGTHVMEVEAEKENLSLNQPAPTSRSVSKHFPRGPWWGPRYGSGRRSLVRRLWAAE